MKGSMQQQPMGVTFDNLPMILATQRISSTELLNSKDSPHKRAEGAGNQFDFGARRNTSSFLKQNNPFFSPKNVSNYLMSPDATRNQMNRTIQDVGYNTIGFRDMMNKSPRGMINQDSSRDFLPDVSIVGSTIYRKKEKPSISVHDVMKVRMKYEKQPFGHSFYKSPSNEMLLKKIQYGKSDRDK